MSNPINATPGPAAAVPTLKPPHPATAPQQPVKVNPASVSWKEPTKFVTDGSTFTPSDFDSYEFGYRPVTNLGDYTVCAHVPMSPGETTVAVASLSLPTNQILQVSVRVVAANGVRSKWAPPSLVKLDSREPESPSELTLA